jgi:hypothetical protein
MTEVRARRRSQRNKKIAVLAATGLIVASGATITSMAAWTDTEWVYGGAALEDGVSTSTFEVNQNVTASATTGWTNDLASPGGKIDFSIAAQNLYPETPVYGFVQLRTIEESLAGDLTLNAPTLQAGGSTALFSALTYGARIVANPAACNETGYGASTQGIVASGSSTSTGSAVNAFELTAGSVGTPGTAKTVCFQLVLPAQTTDALQGLTAQPVWNFTAESKLP